MLKVNMLQWNKWSDRRTLVLANVFDVRYSTLFTCKCYSFKEKLAPFQRHVIQLPAKLDALAGLPSQRREKLIVFSQANGLQFIPKYPLQWFSRYESLVSRDETLVSRAETLVSRDETLVSRDETLVSRETIREVVTYFSAVLYRGKVSVKSLFF